MKLLSDFDGVWTLPLAEGRAQGASLDRALLAAAPARAAAWGEWLAGARSASLADPMRYGWPSAGRLSAFGDEDPFIAHIALLHYLHERRASDPLAAELCAALGAPEWGALEALGALHHEAGVTATARERGPGVLSEAARAGRRMLAGGVEIVLVSNSAPDKLTEWLSAAQVPVTLHPERRPGAVRARPRAAKYLLGAGGDALVLGDARFELDRPSYAAILEDERPTAVVGDVFSLDLALPLARTRRDPAWRGVRLFLLLRDYTPPWLADLVARHAPEVERIEGGLEAVADQLLAS